MRTLFIACLILVASLAIAQAQQPFDMTPERPPAETPESGEQGQPEAAPSLPAEPIPRLRRHLLPAGNMTLAGENGSRSWIVNLTAAQAASPVRLNLAYQNAVVVASEASRLQLLINGTRVIDEPIRAPEGLAELSVELPADLLRAGRNEIVLRAHHRHRTDCTIGSTFELWSEVNAARTYLSFANADAANLGGFDDLRTIGPGESGATRIAIVAPGLKTSDIAPDIMRVAQAVSLHMNQPRLDFTVHEALPENVEVDLRVLLGSAEELTFPTGTATPTGPVAAFAPPVAGEAPTFLVSGRDRAEWLASIEQMLAPVDRPQAGTRDAIVTEAWRMPNAPMFYGERSLTLAELGVRSEQFSGRRHVAEFQFAVPADFYAGSYGEARLLLDAAYAQSVLPGSVVYVYVNGSIASAHPIATSRGSILKQLPIRLTMRHFLPGVNDVRIETVVATDADSACLPGTTSDDTPRFAMFDTSRFVMPAFGRMGQRPDLAALGGTGFPYGLARDPVMIVAERNNVANLSAAANLLARMAISAGRSIPTVFTTSADAARDRDAIFIGPVNGTPSGVLSQLGVTDESRSSWSASLGGPATADSGARAEAEEWRRQMEAQGWLNEVRQWFSQTFEITSEMLRFAPDANVAFTPSEPAIAMVSQGLSPDGNGVWTLVTAPDANLLESGVSSLTDAENWRKMSGRLVTLESDLSTVNALPVAASGFIHTQPASLSNYRLVAANWLSNNILSYALALVVACILLGIATSALLSRIGRRS